MTTQRIMTDIPENEVDEVVQSFKDVGCTNVQKTKQQDGLWTVTADCPD